MRAKIPLFGCHQGDYSAKSPLIDDGIWAFVHRPILSAQNGLTRATFCQKADCIVKKGAYNETLFPRSFFQFARSEVS
jgi:hypothetical protein